MLWAMSSQLALRLFHIATTHPSMPLVGLHIPTLSANINRYIRFASRPVTLNNVWFRAWPHATWVKIFAKNIVIYWLIPIHFLAAYVPINLRKF
jgi:hypothetical protein